MGWKKQGDVHVNEQLQCKIKMNADVYDPGIYKVYYKNRKLGAVLEDLETAKLFAEIYVWAKKHGYKKVLKLLQLF